MKKLILSALLLLMSTTLLSAQTSAMSRDLLREQNRTILQGILDAHAAGAKPAVSWVRAQDKEFAFAAQHEAVYKSLSELVVAARRLNLNPEELLIDISVYQSMGLRNAQDVVMQSLAALERNRTQINASIASKMGDYQKRAQRLRPLGSELSQLDIYLFTMQDLIYLGKDQRLVYLNTYYGVNLGKSLTPVVAKVGDYDKTRAKLDVMQLRALLSSTASASFANEQVYRQTLQSAFGNAPAVLSLSATNPVGMAALLLALDTLYSGDNSSAMATLNQIYAHPQMANDMMARSAKTLKGMQGLYNSLQPKA
jgi:hypothetical protein